MENEHLVPQLKIEAMINVPYVNVLLPRRIALAIAGVFIALLFLWGNGVSAVILFQWIFPAFLVVVLPYAMLTFEKMALDRWAAVLWEYVNLPHHVVWQPGSAAPVQGASRRGGARPDDLFGR